MKQLELLLKDFVDNHYDDYELTHAYSDFMNDYWLIDSVIAHDSYRPLSMETILTDYDSYRYNTNLVMFYRLENRYHDVKFSDMKQAIVNDIVDIAKFIDYLANQMYDMNEDDEIRDEYSYYISELEDEVIYWLSDFYNKLSSSEWLTW